MAPQTFEHKKTEAPTPLEKEKTEKPEESKETQEDLLDEAEKKVQEFKDSGLDVAEKMATAQKEEVDEDIKEELEGQNQEAEGAKEELQLQISPVEEKKEQEIEEMIKTYPISTITNLEKIQLSDEQKEKLAQQVISFAKKCNWALTHINSHKLNQFTKNLGEIGLSEQAVIDILIEASPEHVFNNYEINDLSAQQKNKLVEKIAYETAFILRNIDLMIDKFASHETLMNKLINLTAQFNQFAFTIIIGNDKLNLSQKQSNEMVDKLFATGYGELIAENLNKINIVNHQEIADKLFTSGLGSSVARNIEKFENVNYQEIADKSSVTQKQTIIQAMGSRFTFSFEENEENAIKQNVRNRNIALEFLDTLKPKDKQTVLPSVIEHALDPDFGDLKLAKKLIAQIENEKLRKKWEKMTPTDLGNSQERINLFLEQIQEQSNENRKKTESELIEKYGKEKVEDILGQIEQTRFFTINCSAETVEKILESDRIKSCWEAKTRDDMGYTGTRHAVELSAGIRGKGTKNDPHPIYGAMAYKNGHDELQGVDPGYGNAFIKIKEEILKNRASFTHGDSFDGAIQPRQFTYDDAPIARTRIALEKSKRYVEGQILGGVNLDDIEAVNFPKNKVTPELEKQINKWQKRYPDIKFNIIE